MYRRYRIMMVINCADNADGCLTVFLAYASYSNLLAIERHTYHLCSYNVIEETSLRVCRLGPVLSQQVSFHAFRKKHLDMNLSKSQTGTQDFLVLYASVYTIVYLQYILGYNHNAFSACIIEPVRKMFKEKIFHRKNTSVHSFWVRPCLQKNERFWWATLIHLDRSLRWINRNSLIFGSENAPPLGAAFTKQFEKRNGEKKQNSTVDKLE